VPLSAKFSFAESLRAALGKIVSSPSVARRALGKDNGLYNVAVFCRVPWYAECPTLGKVVVTESFSMPSAEFFVSPSGALGKDKLCQVPVFDPRQRFRRSAKLLFPVVMGYLSPEFVHTGKASTLTDVFAFGIFLLEVTCAQRPVKQNPLQANQNCLRSKWEKI
jgi:hypothetical protein